MRADPPASAEATKGFAQPANFSTVTVPAAALTTTLAQTAGGSATNFAWMDMLWLAFLGGLAVQNPIHEPHKQITLLAIGLFQIFDRRLLGSIPPARRNVYSVLIKILLATFLLGHTGTMPIASPYYLIYFVPVVSAATLFEAGATLFWTAVASAAYCSYLYPALKEYELTPSGATELAIRVLFLFLAAIMVNRFVSENRRQSEATGSSRKLWRRPIDAWSRRKRTSAARSAWRHWGS